MHGYVSFVDLLDTNNFHGGFEDKVEAVFDDSGLRLVFISGTKTDPNFKKASDDFVAWWNQFADGAARAQRLGGHSFSFSTE